MNEKMEKLYHKAVAYDKSGYYRSEEYKSITDRQWSYYFMMLQTFGTELLPLLGGYIAAVHEEMQIERKHAFVLGYKVGKKHAQKAK